jgi:phosphoribosylanthranilate isomerase
MKIKVCGMRDPDNIAEIARLKPDFMGFIFYEPSPRFVGGLDPKALDVISGETKRVGVFVDATEQQIRKIAGKYKLDYVQLHGNESPEMCRSLRGDFMVAKAFGITDSSDMAQSERYEGMCDLYVFDAKTSAYGGSGRRFDHSLLQAYRGATPYLLGGGISQDYAPGPQVIGDMLCAGFDINSRFETAPGIKDVAAVDRFIESVRKRSM